MKNRWIIAIVIITLVAISGLIIFLNPVQPINNTPRYQYEESKEEVINFSGTLDHLKKCQRVEGIDPSRYQFCSSTNPTDKEIYEIENINLIKGINICNSDRNNYDPKQTCNNIFEKGKPEWNYTYYIIGNFLYTNKIKIWSERNYFFLGIKSSSAGGPPTINIYLLKEKPEVLN